MCEVDMRYGIGKNSGSLLQMYLAALSAKAIIRVFASQQETRNLYLL